MTPLDCPIAYRLDLKETADSTGYFAAIPETSPTLEAGLTYLCRHPNDSFMHAHVLACLGGMDLPAVEKILNSTSGREPIVRALVLEAGTVHEHLSGIKAKDEAREIRSLAGQHPRRGPFKCPL
jgi:hypothetical protein